MKLSKSASGKTLVKMSKSEWESYGEKAGWVKEALGEAGEAFVDPQGMPSSPDAGQEVGDVQLSEKAIWGILQQNFGWKLTRIPNGYVLTK